MKKSSIIPVVLALLLSFAASAQTSIQKNGKTYTNLTINSDEQSAKIKFHGEISFNDEETDVQVLSPGGRIVYEKDHAKLQITSDKNGELAYEINGKAKSSFTPDEQRLIADCVHFLIDHGIAAKDRAAKLYARGGFDAVFAEIPRLKDHVKTNYTNYLVREETLSTADLTKLIRHSEDLFSSDYYKSNFLQAITPAQLKDKGVAGAYIESISGLQSDYYRAAVVKKVLISPLTDNEYNKVLGLIRLMDSDYYKADLLSAILKSSEISDAEFAKLLSISASLDSDYYKSQILSSLLKQKGVSKDRYSLTIAAMDGLQSDYHKSQVLNQLIDKSITDSNEWVSLLKYTQKITSDYEKSKILQRIAKAMPDEAIVKENFLEAARAISSDYEYGKVMRAVEVKI